MIEKTVKLEKDESLENLFSGLILKTPGLSVKVQGVSEPTDLDPIYLDNNVVKMIKEFGASHYGRINGTGYVSSGFLKMVGLNIGEKVNRINSHIKEPTMGQWLYIEVNSDNFKQQIDNPMYNVMGSKFTYNDGGKSTNLVVANNLFFAKHLSSNPSVVIGIPRIAKLKEGTDYKFHEIDFERFKTDRKYVKEISDNNFEKYITIK